MKQFHSRNDFLILWFELFHKAHFPQNIFFSRDLLFNDKYLQLILGIGIPEEFEKIEIDSIEADVNS